MPVRDEADHIASALQSVLDQTLDRERLEILVLDGRSQDHTAKLAEGLLSDRANARVIQNPRRTTASSLNLGIRSTSADVVVRVDGHCRLARDYVQTCLNLLSETGAGNVGGLMRPRGESRFGQAMALALCSRFGIGDSRFHYLERRELVESVYLGAFPRHVLAEVGMYDETLLANEDFELNHRIRAAGYGVLLSPEIQSTYTPRESLGPIATQFYRYGRWKARVMRKHPSSIRVRHVVAPALVTYLCVSIVAFVAGRKRWPLLPLLLYVLATAAASVRAARPKRLAPALLLVFPVLHLSWGSGVLVGLLRPQRLSASVGEHEPAPRPEPMRAGSPR